MKKILLFLLLTLCFTVGWNNKSEAQILLFKSTSTYAGITTQKTDTLTNTETTYFSTRKGDLTGKDWTKYRITWKADTLSGTPTTINYIVQGSTDGTKWWNFSGVGLGTDGFNCDSLTTTTAANEYFTITEIVGGVKFVNGATRGNCGMKPKYLRVACVAASGTHATLLSEFELTTAQ